MSEMIFEMEIDDDDDDDDYVACKETFFSNEMQMLEIAEKNSDVVINSLSGQLRKDLSQQIE